MCTHILNWQKLEYLTMGMSEMATPEHGYDLEWAPLSMDT